MNDITIVLGLTDRIRTLEAERKDRGSLFLHLVMPPLDEIDFAKLRKAKGLTQREVQTMTGISVTTLITMEKRAAKHFTYNNVSTLWNLYNEA